MTALREQIDAWAERVAIASAEPDVSDERARELADCEEAARLDQRLGLPPTCACGAGHRWTA